MVVDEELLLRPGIPVSRAIEVLRELTVAAGNAASGGKGLGGLITDYLLWVEAAEFQLRGLFRSPDVWQALFTDRYWRVRDFAQGRDIRSAPQITNEATWQRDRLQAILDQLLEDQKVLDLPEGYIAALPDTSVFMHYEFYDQIPWPAELAAERVRLVVPLLVVDELDDLSFRSKPTSERASKVIKSLQKLRDSTPPTTPVPVRDNVDLQLLPDPPGHRRRSNNDDEIPTRAEYLAAFMGTERIRVITADAGMQFRATARDIPCIQLRDELRM